MGEILKRPTRTDCNSVDYVFAGSNPALPTKFSVHQGINKILKTFNSASEAGIIKAGVAQLVERQPSKLNVAGSNPVSRSKKLQCQLV